MAYKNDGQILFGGSLCLSSNGTVGGSLLLSSSLAKFTCASLCKSIPRVSIRISGQFQFVWNSISCLPWVPLVSLCMGEGNISCNLLYLFKWSPHLPLSWHSWMSSTWENQTDTPWMHLELFSSRFFYIHSSMKKISTLQRTFPWCRTAGKWTVELEMWAVYLQERDTWDSKEGSSRNFWEDAIELCWGSMFTAGCLVHFIFLVSFCFSLVSSLG